MTTVPVPRIVGPSLNVTVPVAVEGATVPVNVTLAPKVVVLSDVVIEVVVDALFTVCVNALEVEVR